MKRVILIGLMMCGVISAETSIGFDLRTAYDFDGTKEGNGTDVKTNDFSFRLYPSLILEVGDNIEIVPSAGFNFKNHTQKNEDANGNVTTLDENSFYGFGASCGFYLRLVNQEIFRLSLGPNVGLNWDWAGDRSDWRQFSTEAGFALNTDLMISPKLYFRMSPNLGKLTYEHAEDGKFTHNHFGFEAKSFWIPSFGLYWSF